MILQILPELLSGKFNIHVILFVSIITHFVKMFWINFGLEDLSLFSESLDYVFSFIQLLFTVFHSWSVWRRTVSLMFTLIYSA